MQIDKISCSQLLDEFGIVPSKDKGQNYLINPATAKRIAESLDIEESDKVHILSTKNMIICLL